MSKPKTYGEARRLGWVDCDTAYARGYVSRKANFDDAPIHQVPAGRGFRSGQYYVELATHNSTQYLVRQYIAPPKF